MNDRAVQRLLALLGLGMVWLAVAGVVQFFRWVAG